jgi:hypothetical protein
MSEQPVEGVSSALQDRPDCQDASTPAALEVAPRELESPVQTSRNYPPGNQCQILVVNRDTLAMGNLVTGGFPEVRLMTRERKLEELRGAEAKRLAEA